MELRPITDGVVTIRPSQAVDRPALLAGRDEEFRRWMGPGSPNPAPTGCIIVEGVIGGWVDYDIDQPWLREGEVNVGYSVFAPYRGRGHASRAVQLLAHHLALLTEHRTMTLLIDRNNHKSLAVARRLKFGAAQPRSSQPAGQCFFQRPVPPRRYSDGTVTIRPLEVEDLEFDLESKDESQMIWLWLPGQRETWEAMTPAQRRAHALRGLQESAESFGRGPKWRFAGDVDGGRYAVYVDCDLKNNHVPPGEANISYSAHPAHRGRGYVSRAVRLVLDFLRDNTAARQAHILVDEQNTASLRVTTAVGAQESERFANEFGHTMIRHVIRIR